MTTPTIGRCPICGQEKWRNDGHPCFTCSKSLATTLTAQRELIAALARALTRIVERGFSVQAEEQARAALALVQRNEA